jgi:hypothetical protein
MIHTIRTYPGQGRAGYTDRDNRDIVHVRLSFDAFNFIFIWDVKEANSANESGAMLELSQQLTYVEHLSTLKETERKSKLATTIAVLEFRSSYVTGSIDRYRTGLSTS